MCLKSLSFLVCITLVAVFSSFALEVAAYDVPAGSLTQQSPGGEANGSSAQSGPNTPFLSCLYLPPNAQRTSTTPTVLPPTTPTANIGNNSQPTTSGTTTPPTTVQNTGPVATSSGSPIGFVFSLEGDNSGTIAADTFLLSRQGRTVKQIGHADVLSSVTSGQAASPTSLTQTGAQANTPIYGGYTMQMQNSADSPFPFQLTLTVSDKVAQNFDNGTSLGRNRLTGQLSEGLFVNGQTLNQINVQCRLFSHSQNNGIQQQHGQR